MRKIALLGLMIVLYTSCAKTDSPNGTSGCTKPASPSASYNSPVGTGGTIKLTASTVSGATYSWTGPGFTSTDQNPVITDAVPNMSGTYSVTAKVGSCTSDPGTVNVTVSNTGNPCSQPDNTLNVSGIGTGLLGTCVSQASNNYELVGSDTNGVFQIIAHFGSMPTKDGTYSVTDNGTPTTYQVFFSLNNTQTGHNYHSIPGLAYVKVSGSKISVNICGITFADPAFNDSYLVSTNITCQ